MNIKINKKDYSSIAFLEKEAGDLGRRLAEKCKYLLLDEDFGKFTKECRKKLNIPKGGFNRNTKKERLEAEKFLNKGFLSEYAIVVSKDYNQIFKEIELFFENKNLAKIKKDFPNLFEYSLYKMIKTYILFGEFHVFKINMGTVGTNFVKELEDDDFNKFILFEFSPYATKNEMLDFIENNWTEIKKLKEYIIGREEVVLRNKTKKNFFRDIYIFNKFEEFKKTGIKYPELRVASFLEKEHGINISDGTIRSIVSRIRNFVANKKD